MYDLTLLVHITFHYSLSREQYLLKVLDNFKLYQLKSLKVIIDTNVNTTKERLSTIIKNLPFSVEIHCHENLSHPFNLAWTHRPHMLKQINNYDIFLYLEDDILIPWDNFKSWLEENNDIDRHGYLRGFLRVETAENGTIYSVDCKQATKDPIIFRIGKKYYFQPQYPYHACWLYNKKQMRDFVKSQAWIDGNCQWGIRERAAFGNMWQTPSYHRTVLPIEPDGTIDKNALNYHLSNNYYNDPDVPLAKISIDNLFTGQIIFKHSPYGLYLYCSRIVNKKVSFFQQKLNRLKSKLEKLF